MMINVCNQENSSYNEKLKKDDKKLPKIKKTILEKNSNKNATFLIF